MKTTTLRKVLSLIGVFVLSGLLANPIFGDQGDPPARVARLSFVRGNVSLQLSGESQWGQASANYTVTTGDRLYTDQGARAELEVGPYAVRLSQTTDLTLANLNDRLMQLGLGQGSIRVTVFELPEDNSVEIDTPNGALTLLRAGSYRVDADPNGGSTLVSVNSGSLEITGGGVTQAVQSGQAVRLTGTGPIQVDFLSLPEPDEFDRWSARRDRRIEESGSSQYVSRYMPGAEDLSTYGHWDTVPEYGPVWYPAGVPGGWVPYRFGHWVWIEPWGWTWVEEEPWGFVPFHYGRWVLIGPAWAWIPGPVAVRPVYAPALVVFVGGPSFYAGAGMGGVQAWFPLGPREPFFPWYHHGPTYLREVNVANSQNVINITNITSVTNITNISYINRGVATTAVPSEVFRSGQPVAGRVVRVTPEQAARAQVIAHPNVSPTASAVFGGRPAAVPPVRAARLATQAEAPRGTPPPSQPSAPTAGRALGGPSGTPSPGVITLRPPPEQNVPFAAREPAMTSHPGRPLEPQQVGNLRAGKPAGPMRDREVPSHPAKAPRSSRPESKPAPRERRAPPR
jgi:hypothetical protein